MLAQRAKADSASRKLQQLNASTLAHLDRVAYLGGFMPGGELTPAQAYDVRFLADRIAVFESAPGHSIKSQVAPWLKFPMARSRPLMWAAPALPKLAAGS